MEKLFNAFMAFMKSQGISDADLAVGEPQTAPAAPVQGSGVTFDAAGNAFYNGVPYAQLSASDKRRVNAAKGRAKLNKSAAVPVVAPPMTPAQRTQIDVQEHSGRGNGRGQLIPNGSTVIVKPNGRSMHRAVDPVDADPVLSTLYHLIVALSEECQNADDPKFRTANVAMWRIRKHANDLPVLANLNGNDIADALDVLAESGRIINTGRASFSGKARYVPDCYADYGRPEAQARKAGQDAQRSAIMRRVSALGSK